MEVAPHVHPLGESALQRQQIAPREVNPLGIVHPAIESHPIRIRQAVFGDEQRRLIALIEETRPPIERLRRDRPVERGLGVAQGERHRDGASVGIRPHAATLVDVEAAEVERLRNELHVPRLHLWRCGAESAQSILWIAPEKDGVEPPGVGPDIPVVGDREHRLSCCGDVLQRLRRGQRRESRWCPPHPARTGAGVADRLHRLAVRQQRVMPHAEHLREGEPISRRVHPLLVSQSHKHLDLVERHPIAHPVAQRRDDHVGVVGEPIGAVAVEPAALAVQLVRQIPVEEGGVRRHSRREERVHEAVVKAQPGGIDLAGPFGQHARPGDGKAVAEQAQIAHQGHIFSVAVIVIARHIAGVPFPDRPRSPA